MSSAAAGGHAGAVLAPGHRVTVRLCKPARREVRYPAEVLFDDGCHLVVRASWVTPPVRDLGFVRFEYGDVCTEHFWRDRWYAVTEVRAADGGRKGWYCDVVRPAEVYPAEVAVTDLILDLWRSADGATTLRLDEDELRGSGLAERDPDAAARAFQALDELEGLARHGFTALLAPRWLRG